MTGWITLHRSIQEHWLYEEERSFSKFEAWIDILLLVNHTSKKVTLGNELILVERGQRITSIRHLCDRWSWSNTKVKNFLSMLESDGMLVVKSDTKKTLITVVNYELYQDVKNKKRHEKDREKTEKRHENDTNQLQKHTNNNDNNDSTMNNNDNNDNNTVGGVDFKNPDFQEIVHEWQDLGFGLITERSTEQILDWLQDHSKDLIIHVIQYAHDNGAINQRYVQAVLKNAKDKNVKTVDDFEAEQKKRAASKANNRGYKQPNKAVEPNWFKEEQKEPSNVPEKINETVNNDAILEKIRRFREN